MFLNVYYLFFIYLINFLLYIFFLSAFRREVIFYLYVNYFVIWIKVIMFLDRKLIGLKSKMEINKLILLNDREDGYACSVLFGGGRGVFIER